MSLVERCDAILALLDEGLRAAAAGSGRADPACAHVDPAAYWAGLARQRAATSTARRAGYRGAGVRERDGLVGGGSDGDPDVAA